METAAVPPPILDSFGDAPTTYCPRQFLGLLGLLDTVVRLLPTCRLVRRHISYSYLTSLTILIPLTVKRMWYLSSVPHTYTRLV